MIQNVEMLHELNHPNILQFIDFFQDENNFYLVTDSQHMSLYTYLQMHNKTMSEH